MSLKRNNPGLLIAWNTKTSGLTINSRSLPQVEIRQAYRWCRKQRSAIGFASFSWVAFLPDAERWLKRPDEAAEAEHVDLLKAHQDLYINGRPASANRNANRTQTSMMSKPRPSRTLESIRLIETSCHRSELPGTFACRAAPPGRKREILTRGGDPNIIHGLGCIP